MAKQVNIRPDATNANKGTERGRYMVEASLRETGAGRSILLDADGRIIAGNKTFEAATDIGLPVRIVETDGKELIAVQRTDLDLSDPTGTARKLAYYDNRASQVGLEWDAEQVLADITAGVDLESMFKQDELDELLAGLVAGDNLSADDARKTLAERFLIPPFSVLDARQGYWQERKAAWLALGIESELGRGIENVGMAHPETTSTIDFYARKRKLEAQFGRQLTKDEAAEIMRNDGVLKDSRQANKDRLLIMESLS